MTCITQSISGIDLKIRRISCENKLFCDRVDDSNFPDGKSANFHCRILQIEVVSQVHPEGFAFDFPGLL
jgi:hypothetical protein